MKNYNNNEIKELLNSNKTDEKDISNNKKITSFYKDEESANKLIEYDNIKTRVLKYIMYKKRTEQEVKNKFINDYDAEILNNVIDELKNLGYINDIEYINRAINEIIALKNLSIKEIKYKLLAKGLNKNIIEDYISNNIDELLEYEIKSAKTLAIKKSKTIDEYELKAYLIKKGFREESIKAVLEEM